MEESLPLDAITIEEILSGKFVYYKKLSAEEREQFVERTINFVNNKEFIPRDGVDITGGMDEMRTLISAAAIQVTFGLEKYEMPHFSKIFIYPREYYNQMTKHWHKGEANPIGALVFSWKAFQEGYQDEHDKLNLGLHEMAHALLLSRSVDGEGNEYFFNTYFDKWWAISNTEFLKLEKHQASFFRDYGGTNAQEFFAVCVEHFFEASADFKQLHPEIYRQTSILLNQDPTGDFNHIASARGKLLTSQPDITPTNLVYQTKGRSLLNVMSVMGIIAFYLIVGAGATDNITTINHEVTFGIMGIALLFFIIRFMKYTEFYVYDNAFAIGYERHGKAMEKMTVINPANTISISFVPKVYRQPGLIKVSYIEDRNIKERVWKYDHIRFGQLEELKKAVKDYCMRNHVGFHNLDV